MTCNERRDSMLLYVAGGMDPAEQEMLRAHLASGCPQCAGALAEAQATVTHVPLALKSVDPPKTARERLMQRVLADASGHRAPATLAAPRRSSPWVTMLAAAAVVLLVISVSLVGVTRVYRARLAANEERLRQYQQLVGNANIDMVKLASETRAHGRIFWDRGTNKWRVQVFDLTPPAPGREYELWFITEDQQKIPAGTFRVDASGYGIHEVDLPKELTDRVTVAAITDEPIGGVMVPTGQIHLAGKIR